MGATAIEYGLIAAGISVRDYHGRHGGSAAHEDDGSPA
jgi:hypothetical protein